MTIKGSGQLGLNGTCTGGSSARDQIGAEVNKTAGTTLCLNNACLRTLSGTSSGTQVSFSTFYGKSSSFTYTVSSNQTNFCMRAGAVTAGWNQTSALVVNINSGVIISSNSTGTPGMTISGLFPGGVTVNNSGSIIGMGGSGGNGRVNNSGLPGGAGGTALLVTSPVTINNAPGTIGGGGGGGGGGGWYGGGGGGGRTGSTNSPGGIQGGAPIGYPPGQTAYPGSAGTFSSAGAGGSGVSGYVGGCCNYCYSYGPGGPGGTWGASGSSGSGGSCSRGVYSYGGGGGGGGGKATCGSGPYITWAATGTRYGSIS